jgi:hypothetical protein
MSAARWLRLAIDWHESEWLAALPWESRACWPLILAHVKCYGTDGSCRTPNLERMAARLDVPLRALRVTVNAAIMEGSLVDDGDWQITNWREYQGDLTAAARMQRHRARLKKEMDRLESVTGVTGVTRNGPPLRGTPPDVDVDVDVVNVIPGDMSVSDIPSSGTREEEKSDSQPVCKNGDASAVAPPAPEVSQSLHPEPDPPNGRRFGKHLESLVDLPG